MSTPTPTDALRRAAGLGGGRDEGTALGHGTADGFFRALLPLPALVVGAVPVALGAGLCAAAAFARPGGMGERLPVASLLRATLVTSCLALALAAPIAFGVAVFLSDLAPHRARAPLGRAVDVFASIPSVVYGLWGGAVLVPALHELLPPSARGGLLGFDAVAVGAVLALMILPTIASVGREVLVAVPDEQREAAIGLGARPWEVVRVAVLPSAWLGLAGAALLGLNRALGETVVVLMVLHGASTGPRGADAVTLASAIPFLQSTRGSAIMESAALLFLLALVVSLLARALVESTKQRLARAA